MTSNNPFRIALIVGSVRSQRTADALLPWLTDRLSEAEWVDHDVVDLRDLDLDESVLQPGGDGPLAARLEDADGFLILTPEYNHSIPGTFKNAVDLLGSEWVGKVVGFVGYGFTMGARAVEHWRQIVSNFEMHDVRSQVGIDLATALDSDGKVVVPEGANAQLKGVVESIAKAAQKLEN